MSGGSADANRYPDQRGPRNPRPNYRGSGPSHPNGAFGGQQRMPPPPGAPMAMAPPHQGPASQRPIGGPQARGPFRPRPPASPSMTGEQMDAYLVNLYQSLLPQTIDEEVRRKALVDRIAAAATAIWPTANVFVYGSTSNKLCLKDADVDVCVLTDAGKVVDPPDREFAAQAVRMLGKQLVQDGMPEVEPISRTRVPVVKIRDETGMSCDICINNMLAVYNSRLLNAYCEVDPRVRPLAMLVKHWCKVNGINGTANQFLSSYAWVIMVLYYLQRCGILPNLQQIHVGEHRQRIVHGYDTYFFEGDVRQLAMQNPALIVNAGQRVSLGSNRASLYELLVGFMEYFAVRFEYNDYVVSLRLGMPLKRSVVGWDEESAKQRAAALRDQRQEDKLSKQAHAEHDDSAADLARQEGASEADDMASDAEDRPFYVSDRCFYCIEDPFEVTHNLGRPLHPRTLRRMMNEMERALRLLREFRVAKLFQARDPQTQRQSTPAARPG